jgi:hypothetical protein
MQAESRAAADGPAGVGGTADDGPDDAAVIRLAWREPEQFAILFRRHAPHIQRYVLRRLGPARHNDPGEMGHRR